MRHDIPCATQPGMSAWERDRARWEQEGGRAHSRERSGRHHRRDDRRSPRRSRHGTPPRGDAGSAVSDTSSVRSLQGLRERQERRQSPARDGDLRRRAAEWMAHEYPGQTAQEVAARLSGAPPPAARGPTRGDTFAAARVAASQPRIDRPHLAASVPYTPSVASDAESLQGGASAFQAGSRPSGVHAPGPAEPAAARCAYCGVSVPLADLAAHMQSGCPARPPAVGGAAASNHATAGGGRGVALTPQAYRARAMEEVSRWLEASGLASHIPRFAELGYDDLPYLLRGSHGAGLDQAEIRQLVADVGMDSADEQRLRDALRGGHAAVPDGGRAAPDGTLADHGSTVDAPAAGAPDGVHRWLEKLNLGQYAGRFTANGYDSLEHILKLGAAEVEQLVEECLMPRGHAARLRHAIATGDSFEYRGRGGAPTAATMAVGRMFDTAEDKEAEAQGSNKMTALRKQLDEASGQLTDLTAAWDELAEEKRQIEMKLRGEFEERMESAERASGLRVAEAERAREEAERKLKDREMELEMVRAECEGERKAKEKLEKQGREREDLAQRTRDGLRKAEEKERQAKLHEEEEVARRQDAERLARERSEATRMALLREEAEKKSRQDAERKAKEREAAMLDLKEHVARERAARESAEAVAMKAQEAERAAKAEMGAEREMRLRFERTAKEKQAAEREALGVAAEEQRAKEEAEAQMRMQVETAQRARVEAERKMRQWQDASLASNAAMEREREQREELEIRAQELTRREEEARTETQDELRQERERYRVGVETIRTQLELEQDERRRVQEVATQAIQREQQMREKDPADLIFDVLDMDKDGQLTKGEFRAQTTDTFAFAGPHTNSPFGSKQWPGWPRSAKRACRNVN